MSFWWHWRALDCWKSLCLIYFGFLTQILWIFRRKKKQTNFHFRFKFKQKCWLLVFGHIRGLNKTSVEHNVNNNSIFHKIKIISMRKKPSIVSTTNSITLPGPAAFPILFDIPAKGTYNSTWNYSFVTSLTKPTPTNRTISTFLHPTRYELQLGYVTFPYPVQPSVPNAPPALTTPKPASTNNNKNINNTVEPTCEMWKVDLITVRKKEKHISRQVTVDWGDIERFI